MDTNTIRAAWLDDELAEQPVPESTLPKSLQGKGVKLVVRELSADEAGDILDLCTNQKTKKLDQKKLMAMVLIASVRNADDPKRGLVWDNSFMQPLLAKGIRPMITIAKQSMELSGLGDEVVDEEKNASKPTTGKGSASN